MRSLQLPLLLLSAVLSKDDSGVANGRVDTSPMVASTITVNQVNAAPSAVNDSYQSVGNTLLQVAASQSVANPAVFVSGSVLANDSHVHSGSLTATLVPASVSPGAVVTMNSDGTFTYLPPAGAAGSDTFSYQVSDGTATSTATVTITFVARVWYVSNLASGDGRSNSPFATLAAAQAASAANDTIFVFNGDGTTANQNGGFVLKSGQRLIGQGVALTVPVSINGGPNPTVLLAAGTKPKITSTAGNGVTASAVSNVEISGLEINGAFRDGVALTNSTSVKVSTVSVLSSLDDGIRGSTVSGFTLSNSTIDGNGDNAAADEAGIAFTELTGAASIANTTIANSIKDNVRMVNTGGVLDRLTVSNVTFGAMNSASGNDGFNVTGSAGTLNVTIEDSFFTSARGDLFQLAISGTVKSDLVFRRNTLSNNHPAIVSGGGGMSISGGGGSTSPTLTYLISQNAFRDAVGAALSIVRASGAGSFRGTVDSNTFGVAGVANSGSSSGSAILMTMAGGGSHITAVTNNIIRQYNNYGIFMQVGNATSGRNGALNATVTGNRVVEPASAAFPQNGFHLNSGVSSSGPDAHTVCLTLSNNTLTGSGKNGGTDFSLRQRFSTTVKLPGYAGANNDNAAVVSFVQSNNPGAPTGTALNNVPPGGGFVGGTPCSLP